MALPATVLRDARKSALLRACDFIEVTAAMAAIFVESKPVS
jgi:hypothetical protein